MLSNLNVSVFFFKFIQNDITQLVFSCPFKAFNLTSSYRLKCVFHFYQTVVKMMYIKSSCMMNIYITKIFENLSKFTFSYLFESKITFVTVITLVGSLKWTVNFSVNDMENISFSGGYLFFRIIANLVRI